MKKVINKKTYNKKYEYIFAGVRYIDLNDMDLWYKQMCGLTIEEVRSVVSTLWLLHISDNEEIILKELLSNKEYYNDDVIFNLFLFSDNELVFRNALIKAICQKSNFPVLLETVNKNFYLKQLYKENGNMDYINSLRNKKICYVKINHSKVSEYKYLVLDEKGYYTGIFDDKIVIGKQFGTVVVLNLLDGTNNIKVCGTLDDSELKINNNLNGTYVSIKISQPHEDGEEIDNISKQIDSYIKTKNLNIDLEELFAQEENAGKVLKRN